MAKCEVNLINWDTKKLDDSFSPPTIRICSQVDQYGHLEPLPLWNKHSNGWYSSQRSWQGLLNICKSSIVESMGRTWRISLRGG